MIINQTYGCSGILHESNSIIMKTTVFRNLLFCMVVLLSVSTSEAQNSEKKLKAIYSFDGSTKDKGDYAYHARLISGAYSKDRFDKSGLALETPAKNATFVQKTLSFPFEIDPDKNPLISVNCWIMPLKTEIMDMIMMGEGKYAHGLVMARRDESYCWALKCGKDELLYGPPVIAGRWVFISFTFDIHNQAARLIVNDEVFSRRAECPHQKHDLYFGWCSAVFDELYLLDTLPELAWIESLSGSKITKNIEKYPIKERYSYRRINKIREDSLTRAGNVFIVFTDELNLCDSTKNRSIIEILKKDDSLKIVEKCKNSYLKVEYNQGKIAYIYAPTLLKKAYPLGDSALKYKAKLWLSQIFNFTKLNNWIMALVVTVIVFFTRKYFTRLDDYIIGLHGYDQLAEGGSKSSSSKASPLRKLKQFFPIHRLRWYPMLTGFLIAFTVLLGAIWDSHEMEWFFNEGFNLLPISFDRSIHYVLYFLSLITLITTLLWVAESFITAGPLIGILRIILLVFINILVIIASFYMMMLIVIIVVGIFILRVLGSSVGSQNYRCPSCGTGFTATPGMGGRCPGCGTSLST